MNDVGAPVVDEVLNGVSGLLGGVRRRLRQKMEFISEEKSGC
jgi:hypothetical protein